MGATERAKNVFDAAIKARYGPFSLYGRGVAHVVLGDIASAERDLSEARKLTAQIDDEVREAGFDFASDAARTLKGTQ